MALLFANWLLLSYLVVLSHVETATLFDWHALHTALDKALVAYTGLLVGLVTVLIGVRLQTRWLTGAGRFHKLAVGRAVLLCIYCEQSTTNNGHVFCLEERV